MYRAHRIANKFRLTYERATLDILFCPGKNIGLDVYSPAVDGHHPVLIFVHGGGWSNFSKELFSSLAMKMIRDNIVLVIPDHTLYPNAQYEEMVSEVSAALSWTLENIEQYGGDPSRVVLSGQSSGGHLTGLTVMDHRFLEPYGHTKDEVAGLIAISTGFDTYAQVVYEKEKAGPGNTTELLTTIFGVIGEENFHVASPINHIQPDLPPILLIHGELDETVPISQSINFHEALQEKGAQSELKIYRNKGHSEILFDALDAERAPLIADLTEFVHRVT